MTINSNKFTTTTTSTFNSSSSSTLERDLLQQGTEYSKHDYYFGTRKIEYLLVRTKRRKTSEIIIDSDEILLRVPYSKPVIEIEELLKEKTSWFLKKQKQMIEQEKNVDIIKPNFSENTNLPYLGNNYKLKIIRKNDKNKINGDELEFNDEIFIFNLWNNKDNIKKNVYNNKSYRIKLLYENWLKQRCLSIYKNKIYQFSKELDVNPPSFIVKDLRKRWGSLTKKGIIILNLHLIKTPEQIIDYIIIHELCHLKIEGHSHKFWSLLSKYVPDYQDKIEWLNTNSERLV